MLLHRLFRIFCAAAADSRHHLNEIEKQIKGKKKKKLPTHVGKCASSEEIDPSSEPNSDPPPNDGEGEAAGTVQPRKPMARTSGSLRSHE